MGVDKMKNELSVLQNNMTMPDIRSLKVKEQVPDELSIQDVILIIQDNLTLWKELHTYYHCAMMEVETKFNVLNQEFSLEYDRNPIESIKTRIKSPESLAEKLVRKNLPLHLASVEDNISDMAGVRVICSFIDDIYMLAESFLRQDDVFLLQKKDYIKEPKPSGYRGLHLVIEIPIFLHDQKKMMKVEVQFRTIAMDFWASLEHKLRYKKNIDMEIQDEIGRQLSECSEKTYLLDREMQDIKRRIETELT